jgi:hypothetical protein
MTLQIRTDSAFLKIVASLQYKFMITLTASSNSQAEMYEQYFQEFI